MKKYGLVLRKKEYLSGLNKDEINKLFDKLDGNEAFPVEFEARENEYSAMGFITPEAAGILNFDYENSGLHDFIALILDNINQEANTYEYEFQGLRILLDR